MICILFSIVYYILVVRERVVVVVSSKTDYLFLLENKDTSSCSDVTTLFESLEILHSKMFQI